jgi:hypothetical protein
MENTPNNITSQEKTFDLTIKNGAAKRLQSLMDHFEGDEAQVISLALELLNLVKSSDKVEFRIKGDLESKGVTIPTTLKKS